MADINKFEVSAVHGVNNFIWERIKADLGWNESDYGGMRPMTTPQQQPEFMDMGKPYIVYNYRTAMVGGIYGYKEDYVVYQFNSIDEGDIRQALNLADYYLGGLDKSAELINDFIWSDPAYEHYRQFQYQSILPRGATGADPSTQEGGFQDGTFQFAIRYTSSRVLGFNPTPYS